MSAGKPDLSVRIGRLVLKNPVMTASGTFGYGQELADLVDLNQLGAIVVKGTTLAPRLGNPPNRFAELGGSAFLTFIGLQNIGISRFVEEKLPFLRSFEAPVIVNIAGESVEEFKLLAETLETAEGVSGIEVNLACPNVARGGVAFSADPQAVFDVVRAVRNSSSLTIIAKVAPTVVDVGALAQACEDAGADAVCPIWSLMGMAIDIDTGRSKMGANVRGALVGPGLKPLHLRLAYEAAQAASIPVIGCGGVCGWEDAVEYLLAGASAVQIGSAGLIDPQTYEHTIAGIRTWAEGRSLSSVREVIGTFSVS
jgi:dihydroorotate dehydrogenase (NAD+) catalytic subunit